MSESLSLRCDRGGVENPWPHRLAVITAGATFLLILAGGLVTNTGAGLAVPDWPTTFGYNMFLYPWSKMVGGIFYEHSHRLIGSVVGLLTLTLTLVLWAVEPRRWLRWLGATALFAVIIQGVLGGLRVILLQETLAIVHGALAQAFFGLTAALALFTSREWKEEPHPLPGERAGHLFWLAALTTGGTYLQLVVGALLTHVGARLDAHLLLATLIAILVPNLAVRILARHADRPGLVRPAIVLCGLLVLQLLLGLGSYAHRFTSLELPLVSSLGLALPVGHRLTGGLMLVSSLVVTLRVHRLLGLPTPAGYRGRVPGRMPA
ncbi:MAG: COX15/CtaA family protein [candidate division NC10 bacterium]